MKNLILFALLFPVFRSTAQGTGLEFWEGPFDGLLAAARAQNKPILLYFHFDGCGACVQMEKKVFSQPAVQNYYRQNFLCYGINTLKGEGPALRERYGVSLQPAFIFTRPDGVAQHKIVGIFSPDDFIAAGDKVLSGSNTLAILQSKYNSGDRSAGLLYQFVYARRDAAEEDSLVVNQYLETQAPADLAKPENIKLIYEFFLIRHKPVFAFESPAFQFMADNRALFETYFKKDQVHTRLIWAARNEIPRAAEQRDTAKMRRIIGIITAYIDPQGQYFYQEMDGRQTGVIFESNPVEGAWMAYYRKSGEKNRYSELQEKIIAGSWDDWEKLNELAWFHYTSEDDPEELQKALKWVERSIELHPAYANTDTRAALLYKSGRYQEAEAEALKAIQLGQADGGDTSETAELLAKIRAARK